MKNYEKIHIWNFPPSLTYIGLYEGFRANLFKKVISKVGSQNKLMGLINKASSNYNIKRNYSRLNLYSWIKGKKFDKGKLKTINIPLWVLIEISKIISDKRNEDNIVMKEIEQNIKYYTTWGSANPISNPKLPIDLTPEVVSVIFHFLGDGHIGRKNVASSYRQMNEEGLNNFLLKLKRIFGNFQYSKKEFEDGRLNVPKVITEFYKYYFKLSDTTTLKGYLPKNIKARDKEFLIAGLASFIVDEGHVGEVITIYSKNNRLLNDIRDISLKCGYICHPIREKYAHGRFDVFRFSISSKSYNRLNEDLIELSKLFPTCNLVQKKDKLLKRIR